MSVPDGSRRENVCDKCDKMFKWKSCLSRHIQLHHSRNAASKFTCNVCSKAFAKQIGLSIHRRLHSKGKPSQNPNIRSNETKEKISNFYKNVVAEVLYSSDSDCEYELLQTVVRIKSDGDGSHKCKFCEKTFIKFNSLTSHLIKHPRQEDGELKVTNAELFREEINSKTLHKIEGVTVSSSNVNNVQINTCVNDETCINSCDQSAVCKMKVRSKSDVGNNCSDEDVTKISLQRMKHKKADIKNDTCGSSCKKYMCKLCNKTFKYACNLTNHRKFHLKETSLLRKHDAAEMARNSSFLRISRRRFSCWMCSKAYAQKIHLDNHMATHKEQSVVDKVETCVMNGKALNDKLFTCTFCGKEFTKSGHFTAHLSIHLGDKPHLCSTCGKSFGLKRYLLVHQRTHTQEKPFTCEQCNKEFIHKGSLVEHLRIHSGDKPHACSICGKKFTHYSGLTQHLRTHTSDKKHVCKVCGKAFRFGGHFREHLRIHSGDRPFSCKTCSKAFVSKSSLTVHLRTHSGERPFQCAVCKKGFIKSYGLTQHRKTHSECNTAQIKEGG